LKVSVIEIGYVDLALHLDLTKTNNEIVIFDVDAARMN
jgi:UDP-glucose 6-dehydrogenase